MPTLDLSDFNIVCSVLGGFFLLFNLVSYVLKDHLYLSDPVVTFAIGVALGPYGAGFVQPEHFGDVQTILVEFARLNLAVGLVLSGIQLPNKYIRHHWRSLGMLLVPVMGTGWIISGSFMYLLIPGISYVDALAIGASITPTDPVLSMSIIKGRYARENIPEHQRLLISAESGANDGFGYPYLYLALYLSQYAGGKAVGKWVYETWLYTILLSVVYGAVVGYLFSWILEICHKKSFADRESVNVYGIVLAVFLLGTCGLIGVNDLLACFIAGNVFTWEGWFRKETDDDSLQSTMDYILNAAYFSFFGAMMPWGIFNVESMHVWRYIVLSIAVLLLKRLPPLVALHRFIPMVKTWKEAALMGYFGPVGLSSIYYSGILIHHLEKRDDLDSSEERLLEVIRPVVFAVTISSIIIHGLSIPVYKLATHMPKFTKHPVRTVKEHWRPGNTNLRWLEYEDRNHEKDMEKIDSNV